MPDYTPSFIKRDPVTGLTFYDFQGHIKATGVDLPVATAATPIDDNIVAWRRADDNTRSAGIFGSDNSPGAFGVNKSATLAVGMDDVNPLPSGPKLILQRRVADSLDTLSIAFATGTKQILASDGKSDFLQLVATQKLKISVGNGGISWPGGSPNSNNISFAHGLTVNPAFFAFFMLDQTGSGSCRAIGVTCDATNAVAFFINETGFSPTAGLHGSWCAVAIA